MNLLFLSLIDFQSIEEHNIYTDLLREFIKAGHYVYIISPTERKNKIKTYLIRENNLAILKLRIGNMQKTNIIEKGLSIITLEFLVNKGIESYFGNVKFDLVLYSTPPITFYRAVLNVKKRNSCKSYLLLKDIFPQNAVDIKILKKTGLKGYIYKYFRRKEEKLYRISDFIGCMSEANISYLLRHNPQIQRSQVEVCPNCIQPIKITRDPVIFKELRKKYGIPNNKIVFLYGGNLGKPQGIPFLIHCLKACSNQLDAFFLIVGTGTEYSIMKNFFEYEKPINALLLETLPKQEYYNLTSVCDVGLIFLDKRFTIPNFPSRILSYMQASMPILAATDQVTDLRSKIREGDFGLWCESGDIKLFQRHVEALCKKHTIQRMGMNSYKYLLKNYSAQEACQKILDHFR